MRLQKATIVPALALCFVALGACGGGGGGGGGSTGTPRNDGVSLSLDVSELSFAAANASAGTPRRQEVEAYFTNFAGKLTGDVFLLTTLSGAAVVNGSSTARLTFRADGSVDTSEGVTITTDDSGSIVITGNVNPSNPIFNLSSGLAGTVLPIAPVTPSVLGAGKFTGTATVRACLGDASCASGELPGSPRTINISYVVDPIASNTIEAPADAVVPRIQVANTPGNVVIRGRSLGSVTAVRFGTTAATAVTAISATEIRAQVPALPAGTYAVTLGSDPAFGATVPFSGSVQVVTPIPAAAQVLAYPGTSPSRVNAAVYDDARQTLFVALAADTPANNTVVSFARTNSGNWGSTVLPVPNLNDLVLANDGSRLLAVTDNMVMELSLDTLAATRTVPAPANLGAGVRLRRLALGNDGQAVITTSNGRLLSPTLLYSTANGTFTTLSNAGELEQSALVATDDGAHIFVTRSVLGGSVLDYNSSNSVVGTRPLSLRHAFEQPLAVDQNVTRAITYNSLPNSAVISGANFVPLAVLDDGEPGVFTTSAAVINRAGTRAIALNGNRFFFFDLTRTPPSANGTPVGTPLSLGFAGGPIQTAVSADGQMAFFANVTGVAVVPFAQ